MHWAPFQLRQGSLVGHCVRSCANRSDPVTRRKGKECLLSERSQLWENMSKFCLNANFGWLAQFLSFELGFLP